MDASTYRKVRQKAVFTSTEEQRRYQAFVSRQEQLPPAGLDDVTVTPAVPRVTSLPPHLREHQTPQPKPRVTGKPITSVTPAEKRSQSGRLDVIHQIQSRRPEDFNHVQSSAHRHQHSEVVHSQ